MKIVRKILQGCAILLVSVIVVWLVALQIKAYRYSVPVMRRRVNAEVPLGTGKAQVIAWSNTNHFRIAARDTQVEIVIDDVHGDIPCGYSTHIGFRFTSANTVRYRNVHEEEVCI